MFLSNEVDEIYKNKSEFNNEIDKMKHEYAASISDSINEDLNNRYYLDFINTLNNESNPKKEKISIFRRILNIL